MKMWLIRWLEAIWYGDRPLARTLLLPLSLLFCTLARCRRARLMDRQTAFPVPVIVVGNLAVGGTGKTPLVIWLVEMLQAAGYKPGVVSRGFGGKGVVSAVTPASSPVEVGDEPLLIVRRTGTPLVVGRDRVAAVQKLLELHACDIVVADDGLQHYRMARDIEILVVDGKRRFGNGLCLPAGPLREKPERAGECDFVVANGAARDGEYAMQVKGDTFQNLATGNTQSLAALAGQQVHVVTAIGNPERFFAVLELAGIRYQPHVYPDHHFFSAEEIRFDDAIPVLMTEKDAVKCQQFAAGIVDNVWYLPVSAFPDTALRRAVLDRVLEVTCNGISNWKP